MLCEFCLNKRKSGPLLMGFLEEPGEFLPTALGRDWTQLVQAKRCSGKEPSFQT